MARRHSFRIGAGAVLSPRLLRAWDRSLPRTADGGGAPCTGGGRLAARVKTADHDPASVLGKPVHDRRTFL